MNKRFFVERQNLSYCWKGVAIGESGTARATIRG